MTEQDSQHRIPVLISEEEHPRIRPEALRESDFLNLVKYFISYFLPIVFIICASTYVTVENENAISRAIFQRDEERTIGRITRAVLSELHVVISDFFLLAEKRSFKENLEHLTDRYRSELEEEYLTHMKRNHFYEELALLDKSGREVLRILNNRGDLIVVPRRQLKEQKLEAIFEGIEGRRTKDIIISPLNLTHGGKMFQEELPVAALYIGKSLFSDNSVNLGMLIVKCPADHIFQHFDKLSVNAESRMMLIDSEGICMNDSISESNLAHGESEKDNNSFRSAFPLEWARITKNDSGQFIDAKGMFTFRTVFPWKEAGRLGAMMGHSDKSGNAKPDDTGYFWKIVSYISPDILALPSRRLFRLIAVFDIILIIPLALITWYLAKSHASRKSAEKELRESEARYSTLVEQAKDGIIIMKGGFITFANRSMKDISGYTQEQILGRSLKDIVVAENDAEIEKIINEKFLDRHVPAPFEIKLYCSDGALKDIGVSAGTIRFKGELAVMWILRDISDRKRVEEELQRLREDFLSTLTHDMKSPLTSMMGYLRLVADPRMGQVSEEKQGYIEMIRYSGSILLTMINNIVNASRIETGQMSYSFEDFSISELIHEIHSTFNALAIIGGISFTCDCPENARVWADREKIREVFYNLLSNAFRFTPPGGTITVSASLHETRILIKVSDTGKGIPESEQGKIFQKFVQGRGTCKGTGLGLYIVKNILQGHSSEVFLESTPGKGSCFAFSLEKGTPSSESHMAKKIILIASDDGERAQALKEMLAGEEYHAEVAENTREALNTIHSQKPDLIIIYNRLTDCDAIKFRSVLKMNIDTMKIPIILISGDLSPAEEGMFPRIIPLPLDMRFLKDEIRQIFSA